MDGRGERRSMVVLALLAAVAGCVAEPAQQDSGVPIRVGTVKNEMSTLLWVAESNGYFARRGLDVSVRTYDSGVEASGDLAAGHLDLATTSEVAYVNDVLAGRDLVTYASLAEGDVNAVVARTDRGIARPGDLAGKRIGIKMGTSSPFWLSRFLMVNGVDPASVTLVDADAHEMVAALTAGDVDAVATWLPYTAQAEWALGEGASSWGIQAGQNLHWVLIGRRGEQAGTLEPFLSALIDAQAFVAEHPAEAQAIVTARTGIEDDYLYFVWDRYNWEVALYQHLLVAFEDEARWLQQARGDGESPVPNFLDYVDPGPLGEADPTKITLIR